MFGNQQLVGYLTTLFQLIRSLPSDGLGEQLCAMNGKGAVVACLKVQRLLRARALRNVSEESHPPARGRDLRLDLCTHCRGGHMSGDATCCFNQNSAEFWVSYCG